ncbi:MAG: transcriptional regulator, partial [Bacteroidetes bacterium]|nr:transcriptional regulator [Bacteroidota bacterium]
MKNAIRKIGFPFFVLLAALLAVQAAGLFGNSRPDVRQFPQKVNLAMRQAADHLLDLAGDTTSAIPPVEQVSAGEYLLRLENNFSYDSLPGFLEVAFAQFGIHEKYYVSVNDCLNNLLILGYSQETLKEGEQPCTG